MLWVIKKVIILSVNVSVQIHLSFIDHHNVHKQQMILAGTCDLDCNSFLNGMHLHIFELPGIHAGTNAEFGDLAKLDTVCEVLLWRVHVCFTWYKQTSSLCSTCFETLLWLVSKLFLGLGYKKLLTSLKNGKWTVFLLAKISKHTKD